jgi:hypothetical protein
VVRGPFHQALQDRRQLDLALVDLALDRTREATFEVDPALVKAVEHVDAWRWVVHALRLKQHRLGLARYGSLRTSRPRIVENVAAISLGDTRRGPDGWPAA